MTQTIVSVGAFLVLLALLPWFIKWLQRRSLGGSAANQSASKIISALAVGPHQRVVTVEVGPQGARRWLVLGVTAQQVNCLHSISVDQTEGLAKKPAIDNLSSLP
jgi:flagellar protein FliO/FliZ